MSARRRVSRFVLSALDVFVALTGIGGGIAVAAGVDRFPPEWLAGTPFRDYVLPGIILTGAVGGSAALASALMLTRSRSGPLASAVAGAVLAGWIVGEVLLLDQPVEPTWIEVVFFGMGVAMIVLGLKRRSRV